MENFCWEEYKKSFKEISEDVLNDYATDLHSMKMKEEVAKNAYLCPAYLKAMAEIGEFDNCNLDYFCYEKEISIGEPN